MRFSVLIPTFNRRDALSRTLSAIFAQDFPAGEYEVVVVVDGSSDGTVEMLQQLQPACGFRLIVQVNRGLPAARNAALAAAEGELVLILDDDIVCDPLVLRRHSDRHGTANDLVVFGPVPLHPESPPGLAAERWRAWFGDFQARLQEAPSSFWLATFSPAVNRSVSRRALTSIGGCDEAMKDCHEDWDMGIRLWKAGMRFQYEPAAVAYHLYVKADGEIVPNDVRLYARGEVALARKHPEYRPLSSAGAIAGSGRAHRLVLRGMARLPFSLEPVLRPCFLALNALRRIPVFRRAGLGLLDDRCSLEIYRETVRITGSRKALQAEFGARLPVLAYHHVGVSRPGTYPDLTVSVARFERQMQWLHKKGYRSITPADWLLWRRDGTALPPKPILLTFDDAYADLVENAFPVMRRYGFGAVVFVVTGQTGGTNCWDEERGTAIHPLMTANQIRHWAGEGIEFGAHTRTHPNLTEIPEAAVKEELSRSRDELAAILGARVTAFAYPYGQYNETTARMARDLFEIAFTTDPGVNDLRTDPFLLRRSCVGHRDSTFDLSFLLRWGLRPIERLRSRLRPWVRLRRALQRMTGQKPGSHRGYV